VGSPSSAFFSEVYPDCQGINDFLEILTIYQIFVYLKYEDVILAVCDNVRVSSTDSIFKVCGNTDMLHVS